MTTLNSKKICAGYQPIPGYTLEEIIGRGGFGEVWRADAPGGLKKAVKFVFGAHDQTRASRELRSLERIKGVNHPFILTLERIEIVDDQLVIVTELAEGSLEDVYKRNRDHGSCGIPRDSLISHLYDAADALDYLHQSYQLQHLDIKPGNLLLVGGHVKVADFGLLKDLNEAECSVVGGLTPIYAPPEVFDGKPSIHSDQYSLAVMYQELLTGTRPFSGRTIAQLATQHVHSAPNLEPLPPGDRPVAARALEKNPERRFANCKDFVEALRNPRVRGTVVTSFGAEPGGEDSQLGLQERHEVSDLPQLNRPSITNHRVTNHALVVALGGTGANCLRTLRSRVADLHSACTVDLHGLLIDTDIATIHSMRVAEASDRVPACQTLHIPLRTAHQYRDAGTDRLKSISRRWIYNVPRSRSTEGMRPLGRLALVDHGEDVLQALGQAIERLSKAAGDQIPSVYVIGSLAGGTSSGIYLDVVHVLRHLLDVAGLEETRILSMLATAELRADPSSPLAMHDTHAAMIEMQHFMRAGNGYPGDEGAGFQSVPAARTPLHDVYLVAASPRGSSSPAPARTITDYVWTDATGGGELLSAARELEQGEQDSQLRVPTLRSVGIVPLGNVRSLEQKLLVPATVRHLLIRWLGLPAKAKKAAVPLADRMMRRCGISHEAYMQSTLEMLGSDPSLQSQQIADHLNSLSAEQLDSDQAVRLELHQWFQQHSGIPDTDATTDSVIANLKREFSVYLHDQRVDVTTVIESINRMVKKLAQAASIEQGAETAPSDGSSEGVATSPVDPQMLAEIVDQIVAERIQRLCERLTQLAKRFEEFATTLAMAVVQVTKEQQSTTNPWDEMPEEIRMHFQATVQQLHELTVSRWLLKPLGDSHNSAADAQEMVDFLCEKAMPAVSHVVDDHAGQTDDSNISASMTATDMTVTLQLPEAQVSTPDSTMLTKSQSHSALSTTRLSQEPLPVEEAVAAARPALLGCGGLQRLVLVVGTEAEREQLEPQVRGLQTGALTVVLIPGSAPKLIHEAQKIEIKQVLAVLSRLNGGNAQVTGRLVTRTDVAWQHGNATSTP